MIKMVIWDLIGVVYQNEHVDKEAKKIIDKFAGEGVRNATISNTFPELIKDIGKDLHLDPALSSVELGLSKRDKEIYKYLLEKCGFAPQECVMIDDHRKNLHAAKELGIVTVLFGKGEAQELGVDYVINDLNEFFSIVNNQQ